MLGQEQYPFFFSHSARRDDQITMQKPLPGIFLYSCGLNYYIKMPATKRDRATAYTVNGLMHAAL